MACQNGRNPPRTMLLLALSACLSFAPSAHSEMPSAELYGRAVARALESAQTELLAQIDLWEDHSRWESAWEVASEHYRVRTTHGRYLAANLAEGMETMLGHFQSVLGTDWAPGTPFEIWVFPTLAEYNQFGNANGAQHSSMYGSFHATQHAQQPVATMYTANPTLLRMWITHAAVHQFVSGAFPATPTTAISEGLAAYFSLYWDPAYAASEHDRVAKGSLFIPLRQLLADPLQSYAQNTDDRLMELGTLFTYLLHHREDTGLGPDDEGSEGSFAAYLRAVLNGRNLTGMPFDDMLANDLDELEDSYRAFRFPR